MIICPNFSNKEVLKEFNELKDLVGEIGAYHIWNEQNGESIDKAPNGLPSKLFADLLSHYNGDRLAAIRAKAKVFTKTFKTWFEGSTHVDVNGEPTVTDFNEDLVFISDSDTTAQPSEVNAKSIENTGSFIKNSKSTTGNSKLDEDLQFYLSRSLDERYQLDVDEFIEAYRQFFDNYDYDSNDKLILRLDQLLDHIQTMVKSRLYVINKKNTSASDEFKAVLSLQIADLGDRTTDRLVNLAKFVQNTSKDVISTVTQVRAVVTGKQAKMPLKQLLELKQDFFDFYCPAIDEALVTLTTSDAYRQLGGQVFFDNLVRQLKDIQTLLNTGANNVDNMIVQLSAEEVRRIGISVGSPTIENYIHEHANSVGKDILAITAWVGAGDKMNDEAIRALFHITQLAEDSINRATFEKGNKLYDLLDKVGGMFGLKKLVELDEQGLPTGYLVRKRNYGKFNKDYKAFLKETKLDLGILEDDDLLNVSPEIRREFNKRKNDWLSEHCERKYTKEYYALFNDLPPLAADARELILIKIRKILNSVKDELTGVTDTSKLSPDNRDRLKALYLEKKQLASVYDINGKLKKGEDYKIAVALNDLNQKLSKGMMLKSNKALFDRVKAEKKASLSEAEYNRWLKENSRDEYTQEFYDDLAKIEKAEIKDPKDAQLYQELAERKRAILRLFRDDKTHEIEKMIPGAAQVELDRIDLNMSRIRKRSGVKKLTGLKFSDIAKVVPSNLFYELRADAILKGSLGVFELQHCNRDQFGHVYPKAYLTKIVPIHDKYILKELPSIYFSEVSEDSPFVNKNYKPELEDDGEYYLPKLELYDNSKAFDKVKDDPNLYALYNALIETIEDSNSKINNLSHLSKYKLPQISGSMYRYWKARGTKGIFDYIKDRASVKNDDTGLNTNEDDDIDELSLSADKLRFVPLNYIKNLDDPATITANTVGSVIQYFRMAENFRVKSELRPKTDALLHFIGSRDVRSKIRGKSKKGIDSYLYKFAKNFVDMNIYDIKTKNVTWDFKGAELSVLGFKMKFDPRKVNFTKLMLGFKALGTTVNLGLNLICALTGALTSTATGIINMFTGRYYGFWDGVHGFTTLIVDMFKNNFGLLSDYNHSTLMKLMEYFNIGAEFNTDRTNHSTLYKLIARNWAFGTYSFSDYIIKGSMLNSVMYNFRFVDGQFMNHEEFIKKYQNDEVMLDQWDSFQSARDLVEFKDGTIKTIDSKYQKAWDARKDVIGATARNLAQSADGQLTPLQKTMLSSNVIGSLVMMHRQFMPIIFQELYSMERQWDYSQQRYREGHFRSVGKCLSSIFTALKRDGFSARTLQTFKEETTWDQRKALKQAVLMHGWLLALRYFLNPLIRQWADDDKDNVIKLLIAFAMVRSNFELMMANTPLFWVDAIATIKTPFPLYSWYDNFSGLMSAGLSTLTDLILGDRYKEIKRGAYKGWNQPAKFGMKLTPFKNLWELQDIPSKRRYYETQIAGVDYGDEPWWE